MKITIIKTLTGIGYIWTLEGTCLFPTHCRNCILDTTTLCNTRSSIIASLNITSFPYTLDTDDYPALLI